jgi:hypothetical protein
LCCFELSHKNVFFYENFVVAVRPLMRHGDTTRKNDADVVFVPRLIDMSICDQVIKRRSMVGGGVS